MNMAIPILYCLVVVSGTLYLLWKKDEEYRRCEGAYIATIVRLLKEIEVLESKKP